MLRVLAILAACASAAVVAGCGSDSEAAGGGDVRVVATTTQAADFARQVGGDRVAVTGMLPPNADPHDYEVRPDDVKALADADLVIRSGGEVDEWLGDAIDASGTDAPELVLADHVDVLDGDPHWWQDPRNVVKATAAIEAALASGRPRRAPRRTSATRGGYTARLERLDREVARCIDEIPADRRTLVTTHDALGSYAARYGLRVVGAVIPSRSTLAQPSAGEVDELIATIEREHVPAIFARVLGQPRRRAGDRRRVGRADRCRALRRRTRPRGLARRHLRRLDRRQHRRHRRRPHPRHELLHAGTLMDLAAPYVQRALLEMLLLAVPAGVLGSWIVLRRLAFFAHAVGSASFPGLVLASAWGIAPQLAALATALGFGVAQEGLTRSRRLAPDAATGLLLVAALAIGIVLASDVVDVGAEVDTLLFGSLIGLKPLDLWLTAAVAAGALVLDAALRRTWLATGFEPGSARALGVKPERADRLLLAGTAVVAVVALDAVGALLVAVVLVVPAATVRLLTARLSTLRAGRGGARGRRGGRRRLARRRARRRRRPRARRARRRRLRARRRGHGAAPAGGAGMSAAVGVSGLSGGYAPGTDALRDVEFAAGPGQIVGVLGPNGGGKTTLFRALLGELPVRRGEVALPGRPAYVPQTERARLDFPVSALDVALMGAYARTPWYRRVARADREHAAAALVRVGLAEQADAAFGTLSGGQRQRVLIARALVQDAEVLLLDEPLSGVDGVSAARIEAVFAELRGEGRTLLVATHDVRQAAAWDRVLCLHRRQIEYGPPAAVLSPETLRETYGGELIVLPGGVRAVGVGHHAH